MTSRERVLAAFDHVEPDIVPRWCGASPEFLAKARRQLNLPDDESFFVRIGDDFRRVFARYVGPTVPVFTTARPIARSSVSTRWTRVRPALEPSACRRDAAKSMPTLGPIRDGRTYRTSGAMRWPGVGSMRSWGEIGRRSGTTQSTCSAWRSLYLKMYDEPELVDAILKHIVDYLRRGQPADFRHSSRCH